MRARSMDGTMVRGSSPSVLHSLAGMLTRQVTRGRLLGAMVDRGGNRTRAAEILGIGRNTLARKLG